MATYRVHAETDHVNLSTTEIESSIGVQLECPSRVDCAERVEQPPRTRDINVNNIPGGLDFMGKDDRRE